MDNSRINPNRFLAHWILNSVLVWLIAALIWILTLVPLTLLYSLAFIVGIKGFIFMGVQWLGWVMMISLPCTLVAYVIGERQEGLVENHLHWQLSGWTRWSAIGGFIGGAALIAKSLLLDPLLPADIPLFLNMPLFVLCLSMAQWYIMRRTARDAWLWILGNVVGGIVFSGLLLNTTIENFSMLFVLWLLATLAQGAITGIVMLWLYDHPLRNWNNDHAEVAPVYVEVRTRSEEDRR